MTIREKIKKILTGLYPYSSCCDAEFTIEDEHKIDLALSQIIDTIIGELGDEEKLAEIIEQASIDVDKVSKMDNINIYDFIAKAILSDLKTKLVKMKEL